MGEYLVAVYLTEGLARLPTTFRKVAATATACTLVLLGYAGEVAFAESETRAAVVIEDAWVRAMPPSQPNTAAYMTLRNTGESAVKLLGATTQPQSTVEIHTSAEVDGMMRMERLMSVSLAPGERVEFAPGGRHFMVLGLEKMPAPGESLKLCLQFDTGVPTCTLAEVRRLAPSADDDMHENHQHH